METLTPAALANKSGSELWQMRKRVMSELDNLGADGRDLTADERATEERGVSNLKAIDAVLESTFQAQAMHPYSGNASRLSQRDMAAVDWLKSAIVEKNPAGFSIEPEEQRAYHVSNPGLEWERRDTLKSTATQAMPVSVFSRFVEHMVETTPVIRAGATVVNTATGEDLQVPKTTAFQTGNLIAEGASITESDPTLAVTTLKSFKYAAFWQLGRELVDDSPTNLLDVLTRGAATALAVSYGNHLANGTGSGQPLGYITAASVGRTSPTGGSTTLGAQATVGLGTDNLNFLVGSIAEPYSVSPAVGYLGTNASRVIIRNIKNSNGDLTLDTTPVKAGSSANVLGDPYYVDPHVPQMAANAKSLAYGDWSRFFVRIAGGVRVERSDEFAFQNDLVSFKAIIRLDGALVDANGIKLFQNSAT